jgi:hypothetical protein
MFPNNPLFVDKLVQSRQEEILRGLPDPQTYEHPKTGRVPAKLGAKAKIWVPAGVLLMMALWFHSLI